MRAFLSLYSLRLPLYMIYMLQQVEYDPAKFNQWFIRLIHDNKAISTVMTRKKLVLTKRALLLLLAASVLSLITSIAFVLYVVKYFHWAIIGLVLLLALPQLFRIFMSLLAWLAHSLIIVPQRKRLLTEARGIFARHKGVKIAVLGSYGKTTMKELLATVLGEGKRVAATPGNMNVSVSHGKFARSLSGDEEVLIVEFGEGEPGDIERMSAMLRPDYAILTGLAPNHLDRYSSLQAVAQDLLSIYDFVGADKVLVNGESAMLRPFIKKSANTFSSSGALGWETSKLKVTIEGLSFKLKKDGKTITVVSRLLGRHQTGPLALVAALATELGLKVDDIEAGLKKTDSFEHRMQPRPMHGAWLIDDTYNGNLEGMQAGLALLSELPAKRRWYVTPGLVDQGAETERAHQELGKAIAGAQPDIVVLMDNSVRPIIERAMEDNGFKGELRIEANPLEFYTNIEHLVAAGDVVLMQNDWTDNYA